jgi:lipopolysaccharide export LptBFGC system permease protein LptF
MKPLERYDHLPFLNWDLALFTTFIVFVALVPAIGLVFWRHSAAIVAGFFGVALPVVWFSASALLRHRRVG